MIAARMLTASAPMLLDMVGIGRSPGLRGGIPKLEARGLAFEH